MSLAQTSKLAKPTQSHHRGVDAALLFQLSENDGAGLQRLEMFLPFVNF